MTQMTLAAAAVLLFAGAADKPDPRLATVRHAFVTAGDALADDKPIAACVAERLEKQTPLSTVDDKADADVVLVVRGHLPGNTARAMTGSLGSAMLRAETPTGELLWFGSTQTRAAAGLARPQAADVPCGLAEAILDKLRQGMREARDRK